MVHGGMAYKERAETTAASCGTSYVSAVSTPLWWIFKNALSKAIIVTHVKSHASVVSLLDSGEQRYIKATNNNNILMQTLTSRQVSNEALPGRHGEEAGAPSGEVDKVVRCGEVVQVFVSDSVVERNQVRNGAPAVLADPTVLTPTVLVGAHVLWDR